MNTALRNALADLRSVSARDLPSETDVEKAQDGTHWSGQKTDGDKWTLTKNAIESYNCNY